MLPRTAARPTKIMDDTPASAKAVKPQPTTVARFSEDRAAFPRGCLAMRIRDEFGTVFESERFVAAFAHRGGPSVSPGMPALVSVGQYAERLTDRQAADAVRGRIDWKYALGLQLADSGFDFSVLSEFRDRLIAHGLEQQILNAILAQCSKRGLLRAGGRARTHSTLKGVNIPIRLLSWSFPVDGEAAGVEWCGTR
ncbi:transposase [Streptomyces sp. NPDC059590]|uniref:transposase n=1 Tax=unclassified Streptomyces TaxID=2593676 RepID=UPI0036B086DE